MYSVRGAFLLNNLYSAPSQGRLRQFRLGFENITTVAITALCRNVTHSANLHARFVVFIMKLHQKKMNYYELYLSSALYTTLVRVCNLFPCELFIGDANLAPNTSWESAVSYLAKSIFLKNF